MKPCVGTKCIGSSITAATFSAKDFMLASKPPQKKMMGKFESVIFKGELLLIYIYRILASPFMRAEMRLFTNLAAPAQAEACNCL